MFRKLRTTYEHLSVKDREIFEKEQAALFFKQLDDKALSRLKSALIFLLDPRLIATYLPAGSDKLGEAFNALEKASDAAQLSQWFLDILLYPFGLNPLGSQSAHYHHVREVARSNRNNHHDTSNRALFKGTQYLPYVNGFSMHGYTFARYLALNIRILPPDALELIIPFFYFNYISKWFHSFAEIDAAFLRASEDASCKALDLLNGPQLVATPALAVPNILPSLATPSEMKQASPPDPAIQELESIKDKICGKLQAEKENFLKRKNFPVKALSEKDQSRYQALSQLHEDLGNIAKRQKEAIQQKAAGNWKLAYKKELTGAITASLLNDKLDKYKTLEKIGIALLNLVSFVFSPIKRLATGTWFYSTVGKPKQAAEDTLEMVNNIRASL